MMPDRFLESVLEEISGRALLSFIAVQQPLISHSELSTE
jgi:hypothetical protein